MCQFIEIDPLDDGMMIRNVKENHVLLMIDNFIFFPLFSGSKPSNSSCKASVHYPCQGGGIPFARNLLKPAPSLREEREREGEVSWLFIYSLLPPIWGEEGL